MFTDMVGYSALMQRNEALALELIQEHHGFLRAILSRHQGNEIKSTGDGLLVEFPSALAAVQCAVEIQQSLAHRNASAPGDRLMVIRIGIHLGDVVWRDNDVLGDGVNIAARIEPLADAGGICISRAIFEQIENKVSHSITKLDSPQLKNITAKVEVFKLLLDGVPAPASAVRRPPRSTHKAAIGLAVGVLVVTVVGVFVWQHARTKPEAPAGPTAGAPQPSPAPAAKVGDQNINQILEKVRQKYDLPAMAMALVTSDGLKWAGVAGVRKRGTEIPVEIDDQWYIGAGGALFTSVLIGQLVDQGKLKWDTTLGEVFPELSSQMDPAYQKVNSLELLSNHAGMPGDFAVGEYLGADGTSLRLNVVRRELSKKPAGQPGVDFAFSSLGYVVAGAVYEKITGKSMERAVTDEIFNPLKMTSAGYGGTGTPGQIDQPWPHNDSGQPAPHNGPNVVQPPVMGPGDRAHCTLKDWAAFVRDQLRGFRGGGSMLRPDSYKKLETPPFTGPNFPGWSGQYALGWRLTQPSWAGGATVLYRGAPNPGGSSYIWVVPDKDFAIALFTNQTGKNSFNAADAASAEVADLLQRQRQPK